MGWRLRYVVTRRRSEFRGPLAGGNRKRGCRKGSCIREETKTGRGSHSRRRLRRSRSSEKEESKDRKPEPRKAYFKVDTQSLEDAFCSSSKAQEQTSRSHGHHYTIRPEDKAWQLENCDSTSTPEEPLLCFRGMHHHSCTAGGQSGAMSLHSPCDSH